MLEQIFRLYTMAMAGDVIVSPTPHLVGPPGCGKSTAVAQAAEMLGVNLHTINVSRMSPLEIEGLQMPVDDNERVQLLLAAHWDRLEDGDILLFDEFLRGFPEVYNGLLDIFTSREVAGIKLPKVFIIAASNSVTTYDPALEDRLLHLPVRDPRNSKMYRAQLGDDLLSHIGLNPKMDKSMELAEVLRAEVLPMYDVLDTFKGKGTHGGTSAKGSSMRKLIGQALLREVESSELKSLINENNRVSFREGKPQYIVLLNGNLASQALDGYESQAKAILKSDKLTPRQRLNTELNLQLIELDRTKKETNDDDGVDDTSLDDLFQ